MSDDDRRHLLAAVELARVHMDLGHGGPFGALIVKDGRLIAEGWNEVTSANDPTAHAEVVAIRRACAALGTFALAGATMYASCEPCPMCLGAIYWARLDRVVFSGTKQQAAHIGFDDAFIYPELERPRDARRLAAVHTPLAEMDAVFAAWLAKADRMPY
jgi:tRNA(Arg) A34 adenosine deaminase TadA